ncbi:MAG: hypothetical protein JSR63_07025 [Proteobacteria bacterium]|nr:hypothetical protein [Pseudomonadota bacterium]MBS0217923.1 hypothetical protein [Pseudomonadota bacterium]
MKSKRVQVAAILGVLVLLSPRAPAQDIGGWLKRTAKQVQDDIANKAGNKAKETVTRPVEKALEGEPSTARNQDEARNGGAAVSGNAPAGVSGSAIDKAIAADTYLAKTCGGTGVAQLPPKRIMRPDPNRPNISAQDLAGERKVIAGIDGVFASWQPNGFVVATQEGYLNNPQGSAGNAGYGNNYTWTLVSYIHDCVDGQWRKDAENGTFLLLFVNSGIGNGVDGIPKIDFDGTDPDLFGYYRLGTEWQIPGLLPQAKNGHVEYTYDADGSTRYWFTRDGRLPFQYVPREEFIRRQLDILQAGKASHQKRAGNARNATFMQLMYDKPMDYYRQLLQKPAEWLQRPSYCMVGNDNGRVDYSRCNFLDEMQPRAQVPVKPDPAYFDRGKPRSAPQYIVIDLRAYGHAEAAARQRALIEQNADKFRALVE